VPFNGSGEEPFSRGNVSVLTQQEIDREPPLIDRTVEVRPPAANFEICLVHAPRGADRLSIALPAFLELRDAALNPPQDRGVGDIDPALGQHLDQVAIAEFGGDVPADTENDERASEVAAMKQGR
jgi:hypothetical protein